MGGFPTRISRTDLGPMMENERPIRNPNRELGMENINLAFWQIAGCSKVAPKVVAKASVSGGVVTVDSCMFAFDPNSAQTPISFTYGSVGQYGFVLQTQYPNEKGLNVNLGLVGGMVAATNIERASGIHMGSNNASVLSYSTGDWNVNELVGCRIHNLTDGSFGIVVSNTVNTITATLSRGTDNDWDTDDEFIVVDNIGSGFLHLANDHQGGVMFFTPDGAQADPTGFTLVMW